MDIRKILDKAPDGITKDDLVFLLQAKGEERTVLLQSAAEVKLQQIGNKVFYRGLVEISNICRKDCFYCGIRKSNQKVQRYQVSDEEILEAARFAWENRYGSMVLQAGERNDVKFVNRISQLLKEIKLLSNHELGITLSLGEQSEEVYKTWFDAGAHRYLLRIETSNRALYEKLHPNDSLHAYETRLQALESLIKTGYQTGTGVMIGLPFQTVEHLADDLLFMKSLGVHMVGMGPYIEHKDTPLYQYRDGLLPLQQRFDLSLKMIACLRLMMPDINIAATTALQSIDKLGREKAIKTGANILMPNITPGHYRDDYSLYENKPCTDENADDCKGCLEARIALTDHEIGYGEWGDSKRFFKK